MERAEARVRPSGVRRQLAIAEVNAEATLTAVRVGTGHVGSPLSTYLLLITLRQQYSTVLSTPRNMRNEYTRAPPDT